MLCKIVITQCRATGVENALGSLFWSCWQNIRELTIDDASFRNFERITRFSFFCQHIMHPPLFSTPCQILPEPIQCNEWPDIICVEVFPLSTFSPFVAIRGNFRPDSLPNVVQMQYCGGSAVPLWLPSHNPPIYGCLEAAPEWGLENREIYEIGQLLFHRAVPKHQLRRDISHLRFNLLLEREGNYEISATESPGLPPLWWSLTEIWIFSWLGPTEPTEPALRGQLGNWIGKGAEITATKAKKNHSHKSEKKTNHNNKSEKITAIIAKKQSQPQKWKKITATRAKNKQNRLRRPCCLPASRFFCVIFPKGFDQTPASDDKIAKLEKYFAFSLDKVTSLITRYFLLCQWTNLKWKVEIHLNLVWVV